MNSNGSFELAQLSEASYTLFDTSVYGDQDRLKSYLQNTALEGDFSLTQATDFATHWEIVDHLPNTASGFSGTVFRRRDSDPATGLVAGDLVFSLRGTEQVGLDLFQADFNEIVKNGLAFRQIIDMYNYWQRLITPTDELARQAILMLAPAGTPENPIINESGVKWTVELGYSGAGLGKVALTDNLVAATGHSLGGHLATAFTRLFSGWTTEAVTFNGAGYPTGALPGLNLTAANNIPNLFALLNGDAVFPSGATNIYGDKNLEIVTMDNFFGLQQPGVHQPMYIEQDTVYASIFGHGMGQMADSAAVFDLLIRLDGSLANASAATISSRLNPLFEAVSNDTAFSLEAIVGAMGRLFTGTGLIEQDNRESLYGLISDIKQTMLYQQSAGLLTIQPLTEFDGAAIAAKAQADTVEGLAYRYALANLVPFAITGDASIYAGHNANGELDLYDPVSGTGALTGQYLKDRAKMLSWKMQFDTGARDSDDPLGPIPDKPYSEDWDSWSISGDWDFIDHATGIKLSIDGVDLTTFANHQIVFGSGNADTLTGDSLSDNLYGNASDDTLTGKGGNDYLEGGAGFDTYVINTGDGHDTILDSDGLGVIKFGTVEVQGSTGLDPAQWKQLSLDSWIDQPNRITYTRLVTEGETRLLIKRGDASVLVRGWSDGQLGIELDAGAAVAAPVIATSVRLQGDLQPVAPHAASGYDSYGNAFVTAEAVPDRADVLYDHETDDRLQGHGGNDLLIAQHGGHDLLEGGTGFDFLMGGIGNDQLFGETRVDDLAAYLLAAETQAGTGEVGDWLSGWDGNDILVGGAGNDALVGGKGEDLVIAGAGNDLVYGDFEHTFTPNPDGSTTYFMPGQLATEGAADVIYGNAGDDQLHGNQGNDILDGGADNDTLYGEAGDDVLLGGEGSDKLYGDGNGTLPEDEGNDYLDGGPGIDYLAGGGGNDTYVNVTGEDTIFDSQGHNTVFVLANEIDAAGLAASVQTNAAGQSFMQVQIAFDSGGALRVDDPFAATGTTTLEFASGEAFDLETLIGERLFTPLNLNLGGSGGRAYGGAGNDTLRGGAGDDTLLGYGGDDTLYGSDGADTLAGGVGVDYLEGGAGDDALDGGAGDDTLDGGVGSDTLQAGMGNDRLYGGEGADTLLADDGSDWLSGGDGADVLEGGVGDDYLVGGTGDDVYRLGTGAGWDTIEDTEGRNRIEFAADIGLESLSLTRSVHGYEIAYGYGWDAVNVSSTWALSPNELKFADATYVLSNELFTGVPVPVWGDEADNVLVDLGPGVEFSGGWGGDDTLIGGAGDNVYYFDLGDGSDVTVDLGGVDTISFGEGITPDDVFVEYGDLGNQLPGLRVYVGSDGDVISIQNGESSILENFQFSDGLTLTFDEMLAWQGGLHTVPAGTTGERHGERLLAGTDGDDALDSPFSYSEGGSGVAYVGGLGDDAIVASVRTGSLFLLNQGDGNDTIRRVEIDAYGAPDALVFGAGITPESLSFSFVERTVTGDGGPFIGVTTYTVTDAVFQYGSAGDSVTMLADSLADLNFMFADGRVGTYSALTSGLSVVTGGIGRGPFDLPPGDDAHPAVYWSGTTDDDTYAARDMLSVNGQTAKPQRDVVDGGAGNDHIATRAGNDWLTGGQGNDLLEGGTGSDVYVFAEGDGADTIRETTAAGEKNYVLIEGEVAPTFEYDGSDLLVHYNNGADVIRVEHFFSSGLDEHAAISGVLLDRSAAGVYPLEIFYSLDDIKAAVHIKNGSPDDDTLVGSAANDFLFGNAGADTLQGSKGDDTLIGGAGDDTYVINLGDGVDTIRDSFAEGENNTIVFGAGVDPGLVKLFKGSLGLDLGGGNTVHIEGVDYDDLANTSSIRNFMFADGTALTIEQLLARGFDLNGSDEADTLSGTSASDRIEGGAGNDNLSGLAGNDVLDGNAGNDTLAGGAGDDTYIVDSTGDHVMENAGEGTDSIQSSVTLTLAANVENLALTGAAAINGTGNELGNVLTGNSANNRLVGGLGNDTLIGGSGHDRLDGGAGADTMAGGLGNDAYVVDDAGDVVTENAGEGSDSVEIYAAADFILDANLENGYRRGTGSWTTMGNAENNFLSGNSGNDTLIGLGGNDRLLGGVGADTLIGGMGDDTYFVDDANDVVTELANAGVDHVHVWKSMAYTLAANVENGSLGQVSGSLTGNALDNSLNGSWSDDVLDGGGGADTLAGSGGNDTYVVGRDYGTDTVIENDTTAGNTDVAQFLAGVASDQIWFLQVGNNLEASIIGTSDKLVIQDWYLGSANHVEQFKITDGARTLLDSNVQNLVNAMASFAPPAAGQTTLPPNYQNMLADVIAANWQ